MRELIDTAALGLILTFSLHIQVQAQKDVTMFAVPLYRTIPVEMITRHTLDQYHDGETRARRTCENLIVTVREKLLAEEPELRDEAYTTILWLRIDAEEYFAQGEYDACIEAMITVKQIAGL